MKEQPDENTPSQGLGTDKEMQSGEVPGRDPIEALKIELQEKIDLLSKTNRQLKRKVFDLYTVFEISRNFNSVLDYHLLLDTFIFTCLAQVGLLKGAIFLKRDVEAREYHLIKAKGSGGLPTEEQFFSEDSKLAEHLTKLNHPISVDVLMLDITSNDEKEILKHFENGLVVPLIYQTRLAGLFLLADSMTGREFTPDDIEFLSALGNQIAVAIENARLYEAEKAAIGQLRAAQQQLVQSERLAALGEMSAKIAHEVNNPLGIIKNYVLLLNREAKDNEKIDEYTSIVGQEIDRIAKIVGQLREFQRPVRMERAAVDVGKVLEETIKLMERQLHSDNIKVHREFKADRTLVTGSADSLKQVFLNLVINSRQAMVDGGDLSITMYNEDDNLVLGFLDTGCGIPPEIASVIFEPFFTTKGEDGSGLGLSVCYGIIRNHQGSIKYKDQKSGGFFEIVLPLQRDEH